MAFKFNPISGNLDLVNSAEQEILKGDFSAANNQSTVANVTGLDLASITGVAFEILLVAKLDATSNDTIFYSLQAVNEGSDYVIAQQQNKQNSLNINFSVTSIGQIQYTSDNYAGFVSLDFSWKIIKL
jgi:hypothetical protein